MRWTRMAALGVAMLLAQCSPAPAPKPADAQIGSTIAVDPAATIQAQPAALQSPVHANDRLETGPDGAIRVQFVDTTFFSLGANGSATIDKFVYDPGKASQVSVAFARGAFRFVSGAPLHADPGQPAIRTPVAVIGVRGTGVDGVIGPEAEALFRRIDPGYVPDGGDAGTATLILLTEGAIDVTGSGVTVTLDRPGQVLFFRRKGAPPIGPVFAWSDRRAAIEALASPPGLGPEPGGGPARPQPETPAPTPSSASTPPPASTPSPVPSATAVPGVPTPEPTLGVPPRRPPWQRPTPQPTYRPADAKPTPAPQPTLRPPATRFTPVPTPRPTYRPPLTRATPTPTPTFRPPVTRLTPVPTPRPTYRPPVKPPTPRPTPTAQKPG